MDDTVAYSRQFLQSTGNYTGDLPRARGKVIGIRQLGDVTFIDVEWNLPDIPRRVNASNLVLVTAKGIMDRY